MIAATHSRSSIPETLRKRVGRFVLGHLALRSCTGGESEMGESALHITARQSLPLLASQMSLAVSAIVGGEYMAANLRKEHVTWVALSMESPSLWSDHRSRKGGART